MDSGSSGAGRAGLPLILALVLANALDRTALESDRPDVEPLAWTPSLGGERLTARLWQDPLEIAYSAWDEYRRAAERDQTDLAEGSRPAVNMAFPGLESTPLVLGVMVPGGSFPEQREKRVRTRYAVVAGLTESSYYPRDGGHMGYALAGQVPAGPSDAGDAGDELAQQLSEAATDSTPVEPGSDWVLPFEWYQRTSESDSAKGGAGHSSVLVVWIDESRLGLTPLAGITELVGWLRSSSEALEGAGVRLLGPESSTTLRRMGEEDLERYSAISQALKPGPPGLSGVHRPHVLHPLYPLPSFHRRYQARPPEERDAFCTCAMDANARYAKSQQSSVRPLERPLLGVRTLSSWATVADSELGLPGSTFWSGLEYQRMIGTDDAIVDALIGELNLRIPALNKKKAIPLVQAGAGIARGTQMLQLPREASVLLVTEADTLYGRNWIKLFRGRISEGQPGEKPSVRLETLRYLRGIDGKVPGRASGGGRGGDGAEGESVEPAFGEGQLDYVQRLDPRLEGQKFDAVGVLGSDVYDKLAILQVIAERFPDAVLFTADLDARLIPTEVSPETMNLVVASHFGITGAADSSSGAFDRPPFRSGYQTALWRATREAVAPASVLAGESAMPAVSVFEMGRHGPFRLNTSSPRAASGEGAAAARVELVVSQPPAVFQGLYRALFLVAIALCLLACLPGLVPRAAQRLAGVAARLRETSRLRDTSRPRSTGIARSRAIGASLRVDASRRLQTVATWLDPSSESGGRLRQRVRSAGKVFAVAFVTLFLAVVGHSVVLRLSNAFDTLVAKGDVRFWSGELSVAFAVLGGLAAYGLCLAGPTRQWLAARCSHPLALRSQTVGLALVVGASVWSLGLRSRVAEAGAGTPHVAGLEAGPALHLALWVAGAMATFFLVVQFRLGAPRVTAFLEGPQPNSKKSLEHHFSIVPLLFVATSILALVVAVGLAKKFGGWEGLGDPKSLRTVGGVAVVCAILTYFGFLFQPVRHSTAQFFGVREDGRKVKRVLRIAGVAILAVVILTLLGLLLRGRADGEPLTVFDGISIWPSEMIRGAAVVYCGFAFVGVWRSWSELNRDVAARFELEPEPLSKADLRARLTGVCMGFVAADSGATDSGATGERAARGGIREAWADYRAECLPGPRARRIFLGSFFYYMLTGLLFATFGSPSVPYRGWESLVVDRLTLFLAVSGMVLLTYLVVDASLCSARFLRRVREGGDAIWADVAESLAKPRRMNPEDVSEVLGVQLVERMTRTLSRFLYYPAITLFLLVVSRSRLFDAWDWSPALVLTFSLSFLLLVLVTKYIGTIAQTFKRVAVERLTEDLRRFRGEEPREQQLDAALTAVQSVKGGSFAGLRQHPLVRVLLLPFAGLGAASLMEFFFPVWMKF